MPFWYVLKFAVGMYRSKVCLVLILCTCELDRNWSLFLVTNKSIEYIYIGTELEGCLSP